MTKELIIATRQSQLALWQAYHVKELIEKKFSDIKVIINKMTSKGDKILHKPLALIGGKGHFTKELEDAMLEGKAHMAVHSLKDVPTFIPKGLELAAITKRQDQSDLFLSQKYKNFEELPKGAIVGTTSLRRKMQILHKRPDLKVKDLRGNVNTRLQKLKNGEYDAIVLAYIGLKRLNLIDEIKYSHKLDFMIPPMGQAALGIEIVKANALAKEVATALNDEDTFFCTMLERDFLKAIEAGCSSPVAVNASIIGDEVVIKALIGTVDGKKIMKKALQAKKEDAKELGIKLAQLMLEGGAKNLLKEAEENAFKEYRAPRL